MSEELTRERIEIYANAEWTKPEIRSMAKQLLAEMDKPGVWDGAPDWATVAHIGWYKTNEQESTSSCERYTRELPKTRARQIAEEFFEKEASIGFCELAILRALEEKEANR